MSGTLNFFSGWLGFGSVLADGTLSEPSDPAYARRPVLLGPLNGGRSQDMEPGTVGPATQAWAPLLFAGLFDLAAGGDLLAAWSLPRPVTLLAGQTWTSEGDFSLQLLGDPSLPPTASRSWVAGTQFATIGSAANPVSVTACLNLQVSGGQLVLAGSVRPGVNLSNLPLVSPPAGSGALWNNGGVICVA